MAEGLATGFPVWTAAAGALGPDPASVTASGAFVRPAVHDNRGRQWSEDIEVAEVKAYEHAMVCIDLRSMEADLLLHKAADLVRPDGRLSAVTVIEVGTLDAGRDVVASMVEEEYQARSAHLARLCEEAACADAETRVLVGKAPAEIAAYAEHGGCDVVVLGDHQGPDTLARLGSTTDGALRLLRCDALVVKTRTPADS